MDAHHLQPRPGTLQWAKYLRMTHSSTDDENVCLAFGIYGAGVEELPWLSPMARRRAKFTVKHPDVHYPNRTADQYLPGLRPKADGELVRTVTQTLHPGWLDPNFPISGNLA